MIGVFMAWTDRTNSPGYVIDGSGCHIWIGYRNNRGYGMVTVGGQSRVVTRVRYEREVGPIPEGHELDHYICDNGPGGCCNPHHVRPVVRRENQLRGNTVSSANAAKTHCPKGHPLEGDNLVKGDLRLGWRNCRACRNTRERAKRAIARRLAKEIGADGGVGLT